MNPDLLSQLRDIHYPAPISIWPLAPGWYFVIVIVCLSVMYGIYAWIRYWRRHRIKRIVLKRIAELQAQQAIASNNVAVELSSLLKRAALAKFPRHKVAGLYGEDWLLFLDKTALTQDFSQGPGRLLIICPYRSQKQNLPETLFEIIRTWVRKNL